MPRSKILKPLLVSFTFLAATGPTFAAGGHGGGGGGGHGGGGGGHASAGGGHASGGGARYSGGGGGAHYSAGGGTHSAVGQTYGGSGVGRGGSYSPPAHSSAGNGVMRPVGPQGGVPAAGVMRPVGPGGFNQVAPSGLASHQPYNLSQSAPHLAGGGQYSPGLSGNRVNPGNSPAYRAYGSLNTPVNAANTGAAFPPATNFGLASGNRSVTNVNVNVGTNGGNGFRYGLGSQAYGGQGFVRPVGYGGYSSPYGSRNYGGYGGYGGYFSPYGFGLSIGFGSPFGFGGFGSPFGYSYGGYGGYGYAGYGRLGLSGYGLGYGGYGYVYGGGYGVVPGNFDGVGYGGSYSQAIVPARPVVVLADFVPQPQAIPAPVVDQSVIPPAVDEPTPAPAPLAFSAQADQLVRAGKYEEAARAYRHASVDEPQNGTLAVRASQALTAAGKYDEAAGAAQQGFVLIDPKDWLTAAKDSANVFGDPQAAAAAYEALLKASADAKAGPGVKFLSGVAAAGRGDYPRAAADLDAVTKLVPQDTVAAQWKTIVEAKK